MRETYYMITYSSKCDNGNIKCEYNNFDKYDFNSAIKAYQKLNELQFKDIKLYVVGLNKIELAPSQIPQSL